MKHIYRAPGESYTDSEIDLSEGKQLLAENPRIRDGIRFRSNRWEMTDSENRWQVFHRDWVRIRLTRPSPTHPDRPFFVGWKAESIMLVLKAEGANLESDDPNPVLLTKPELRSEVRNGLMPKVRQFFRHSKRTFYERVGQTEKWKSLGDSLTTISTRLDQRMVDEGGRCYYGSKKSAVIEELKLEGRK